MREDRARQEEYDDFCEGRVEGESEGEFRGLAVGLCIYRDNVCEAGPAGDNDGKHGGVGNDCQIIYDAGVGDSCRRVSEVIINGT